MDDTDLISRHKSRLVAISWGVVSFGILFFYLKSCAFTTSIVSNLVLALIDFCCLVCCSYFARKHLIPEFLYRRRLFMFAGLLFLQIAGFANLILLLQWCWYSLSGLLAPQVAGELLSDFFYQFFECYMVIFIGSVVIIAYRLLADHWLSQTRFEKLQKEKAQTELRFLKAQINPHFLFNSINSIFAHIDKNNRQARDMVLKFSDMLRYQLYECNVESINFQRELSYLNSYVELQKLRKEDNLEVTLESDAGLGEFRIAPLLLIPFIENAFKYASNHEDRENTLKVMLTKENESFNFYCCNTRDRVVSLNLTGESGIGINNVRRRLELLYPGKHELQISDEDLTFEVNLKIEMT